MRKNKKLTFEPSDFRLRFETGGPLLPDDPSDFVRSIHGTLNIFDEQREEFSVPVGHVSAYHVEIGLAKQAKEPITFVFDSVDDELADYFSILFEDENFSEGLEEILEPGFGGDLLIIDRVEIDPEFRGKNLGLIAALKTIETFSGGCAYVALRPFPLQYGPLRSQTKKLKQQKYDRFVKSEPQARKKLRDYWGQLGFKRVHDSDVFILSTAYHLPTSVAKLCKSGEK